MTTPTPNGEPMRTAPPLRAIVALLVLVVVMVTGVLVLFALTPPSERPNPWAYAVPAFTAMAGAVPAVLAWLSARSSDASATSAANSLNGGFEERVKAILHETLNERQAVAGKGVPTPRRPPAKKAAPNG